MSNALTATSASAGALLMDNSAMDRLERIADMMACGKSTIPAHLRGSKADCFAVCLQSMQWGMNPFAVAQKTHLVNGTLGYEAQLVAAVINTSGAVKDRFHFDFFGPWERVIGKFAIKKGDKGEYRVPGWSFAEEEGCGVRVSATLKGESAPRVLELLLAQARVRNSGLWADDPKQQLAYLAQKKWSRLFAPDVILGVYTADELQEPPPAEKHMGMAEVLATVAPAEYPQAEFEKNLPAWAKVVASGRKSLQDLAAMVGSKAPLTAAQMDALSAAVAQLQSNTVENVPQTPASPVQPLQPPVAATAPDAATHAVTFERLRDAMVNATNLDALFEAADLISEVADPERRAELTALFDARQLELEAS